LAPYSSQLYNVLSLAYISAHKYSEGLEIIRKGLELFPGDRSLRLLRQKVELPGSP